MFGFALDMATRRAGVVTLSGESVSSSSVSPNGATARISVKTDGTITKTEDGVETQIDALTDWIIPNTAGAFGYQIRFTNHIGDALFSPPGSENEWIALDQNRLYALTRVGANVGSSTCSFNLEIRRGTGPTLASGSYSLAATVT